MLAILSVYSCSDSAMGRVFPIPLSLAVTQRISLRLNQTDVRSENQRIVKFDTHPTTQVRQGLPSEVLDAIDTHVCAPADGCARS